MANFLKRQLTKALISLTSEKAVAGGSYPLPISGGSIPASWDWGWWQQGKNPQRGAGTSIVHSCADAYAQTIASMRAYHNSYDENETRTRLYTTSLSRVLNKPNDYQTRSDFFLNVVKELLLEGNAYIVGYRNDRNEIAQVHQLRSRGTLPYIDPETRAVFYAAGANPLLEDIDVMIPARDMCHIRLYTPRHPLVGVSPIENAISSIVANSAITDHQATFFRNMSRPSGLLSTEMKLTVDQMTQLRTAWQNQSKDMNAGGIPILGSGIKWNPMSITSQDSQLVEAFNMTIEDIARAFRVPLPLVNDNRNSTYNNVEQLINHWLSGGLGFLLDHVENNIDKFFGLKASERTEFDTDSLMRTDFSGRIDGFTKGIQFGLFAPNEARSRFGGLKPVEHGDKPIVQQQMVPLGWSETQAKVQAQEAQTPEAPAPEPAKQIDEEEQEGAAIYYLKKAING